MAAKTANVLARVEPDVKEQAEAIALSVPSPPIARDEMDTATFNTMMEEGLSQARAGHGYSLDEAFNLLHEGV